MAMHHLPHSKPTARIMAERELALTDAQKLAAINAVGDAPAMPTAASAAPEVTIEPITGKESSNPLRPRTLDEMIGQPKLKPLLAQLIAAAKATGRPLDHLLLVGASGTGKTTVATVIGNAIGARVFAPRAPLDMGVLGALRKTVRDGDVIFVDEIHLQVSGDRRGITQACDSESFYLLLEDGVLATASGPVPFPKVTWIGATTDVGLLPEPLSMRFPIQPRLAPYTPADMELIAYGNARALRVPCEDAVYAIFGGASRGVPRQVNNYMRAARQLAANGPVTAVLARQVVEDLASTTLDGLTQSMQIVLRYLYAYCGRDTKDGRVYSASVNTLATAAGHGRDTKAISLLVEPYLLQRGLLQVRPTGRTLTEAGVARARQLLGGQ